MTGSNRDAVVDWELVRLPSLFSRVSPEDGTATREVLREALVHQEHIDSDVADMVIQSTIDDGIIERQNGEELRLLEDVNDSFEDFHHGE